jgi:hypothetical protein
MDVGTGEADILEQTIVELHQSTPAGAHLGSLPQGAQHRRGEANPRQKLPSANAAFPMSITSRMILSCVRS